MIMMLNYSAGRPRFLDLMVLLGLIIGIFVYTENSVPGFSTFSTRLAQHSTISTTTCDERLDELDRTFNRRRDARIELIDINKAVASYDLYESEAVCFSEERFGSTKRYTAYGDGKNFLHEVCIAVNCSFPTSFLWHIIMMTKVRNLYAVLMSSLRNRTVVKVVLCTLLVAITISASKWVSVILWAARRTRSTQL